MISSLDAVELEQLKDRLEPFMETQCGKGGMTMIFYMLTNIIKESTQLLCIGQGSRQLAEEAFGLKQSGGACVLQGVVSRKKQLIPAFMNTLQENQ